MPKNSRKKKTRKGTTYNRKLRLTLRTFFYDTTKTPNTITINENVKISKNVKEVAEILFDYLTILSKNLKFKCATFNALVNVFV